MFHITSTKLNKNGEVYQILDEDFEFTKDLRQITEDEHDLQFVDYRAINQEGRIKYIYDRLSKLTIDNNLKQLDHNKVGIDFDATSLCPSAMWDER